LADPRIGTLLKGTYRIEHPLGVGGMGAVYAASHRRLPRRYAIKFLDAANTSARDAIGRFRREAFIAGTLNHPHIVEAHDIGVAEDGSLYMVLELLQGQDLDARLERMGQLTPERTLGILRDVASAVDFAHESGVVHRDLKPANVFLCSHGGAESAKVLDFGISKLLSEGTTNLTLPGQLLGTPNYMAPEQATARGDVVGPAVDIFALGAIAYECLTGTQAFRGATPVATLYQICHSKPVPASQLVRSLPTEVDQVLDRAMAHDPARRFTTATELVRALADALGESFTAAPVVRTVGGTPSALSWPTDVQSVTGRTQMGDAPVSPDDEARRTKPSFWTTSLAAAVVTAAVLGSAGAVVLRRTMAQEPPANAIASDVPIASTAVALVEAMPAPEVAAAPAPSAAPSAEGPMAVPTQQPASRGAAADGRPSARPARRPPRPVATARPQPSPEPPSPGPMNHDL
jgi:serine/threonine-protein kinase